MDAPWLVVANYLKGASEYAGALTNPKIEEMFSLSGSPWVHSDETPWCAAFVGACLRLSGYKSSNNLGARSYMNFGATLDEPLPGCIVVFWKNNPDDASRGHVAFLDHVDENYVYVLGGNQGNMVQVTPYKRDRVLTFRQPIEVAAMARSNVLRNFAELTGGTEGVSSPPIVTSAPIIVAPPVLAPTPAIVSTDNITEPARIATPAGPAPALQDAAPPDLGTMLNDPDIKKKLQEIIKSVGQPGGLTPVNAALGQGIGQMLNGNKTTIGTMTLLLSTLVNRMSPVDAPTVQSLQHNITPFMQPVALTVVLWGLLGKYEKWVYGERKKP